MLRPIKNSQLSPRAIGIKATNNGAGAITSKVGEADVTFTYTDVADTTCVFKKQMQRGTVVVASAGDDIVDGGYPFLDKATRATDKTGFIVTTGNASGVADAGTFSAIAVGWDSQFTDSFKKDTAIVHGTRPLGRMIGFRVAAGVITHGTRDGSIVTNSTGNYTITFRRSYGNANVVAVASVENSSGGSYKIVSATATSVNIKTFNTSNVAAAINFHLIVLGWDTRGESGKQARPLESTQIRPRLLAFHVVNTAGTPAVTIGNDVTVTDNGTGDYTFTFRKPFERAPLVVGIGNSSRFTVKAASTTTAVTVVTRNAAHAAADADCSVLVLGFDSPDET